VSVYVTREVWKYSRAEHGARLVLLAIADSGTRSWDVDAQAGDDRDDDAAGQ
jgi:hypothetical protein